MHVSSLLDAVPGATLVRGRLDSPVGKVREHDQEVGVGDVFVAIRGARSDGHDRLAGLAHAGLIVVERNVVVPVGPAVVQVASTREALAPMAARAEGDPGRSMPVVAVTGTNGKTSTTYMVAAIARAAGLKPGIIGTTGHFVGSEELAATHTTPGAPVVQGLLAKMRDAGCGLVAMEASSIGLDARRCDAIPFRAAVFTNLTRDHLDYHGTMQAYSSAKARLFGQLNQGMAVLNADDPACRDMGFGVANQWTFGIREPANIQGKLLAQSVDGMRAEVSFENQRDEWVLPMVGLHNLHNALGAVGAALALGIPWAVIGEGLTNFSGVPGRLERVLNGRGVAVFVDYAHTDDALSHVLSALRELSPARILTVFGCGGDRDAGKRPLMGRAAALGSDHCIVTSDNPRGEIPEAIIRDILVGIGRAPHEVEPDRAAAIARVAAIARPGDIVLIAGKGHETYQEQCGVRLPFDDRAIARGVFS